MLKKTKALINKSWLGFFLLLWDLDEMIFYMKINTCISLKPSWSSCKNFIIFQGIRAYPPYKHKNFAFKKLFWNFLWPYKRPQKSFWWIKWNFFSNSKGNWRDYFFLSVSIISWQLSCIVLGGFFLKCIQQVKLNSWSDVSKFHLQLSLAQTCWKRIFLASKAR